MTACKWPTCDHLYLPDYSLQMLGHVILVFRRELALVLIIISKSAAFSLLYIPLQFPLLYKLLYLFF